MTSEHATHVRGAQGAARGAARGAAAGALTGALTGALAAVVGGLALRAAWEAGQRALPPAQRLPSPTDRTVGVLAARRGVALSPGQTRAASVGMYTGAMLTWGAVLGAAGTRVPMSPLAQGLLLGGVLYAANFPRATGVLPRLGVLPGPGEQTRAQAAVPVAAHLAGGLATAAALTAIDRAAQGGAFPFLTRSPRMAGASRIREHMEVVGSDGQHVGTVDHVEDGRIKLTRKDPAAGGEHHYLDASLVAGVDAQVRLSQPAEQVRGSWQAAG